MSSSFVLLTKIVTMTISDFLVSCLAVTEYYKSPTPRDQTIMVTFHKSASLPGQRTTTV